MTSNDVIAVLGLSMQRWWPRS